MRRPKTNLVASLIVLLILAGCAAVVRYNYDDPRRCRIPSSSIGYAAMDRHFSVNSTIPQYLFIQSPHDLRTPEALADMEQMAQRVSQLPGIAVVRGITRPTGAPLEQARLTYQAGEVGNRLDDASVLINDRTDDLDRWPRAPTSWPTASAILRDQMAQAHVPGVGPGLVNALAAIQNQFGGDMTSLQMGDAAASSAACVRSATRYRHDLRQLANNFEWVDPVVVALDGSPYCDSNPVCSSARDQFRTLQTAGTTALSTRIAPGPPIAVDRTSVELVADGDRD